MAALVSTFLLLLLFSSCWSLSPNATKELSTLLKVSVDHGIINEEQLSAILSLASTTASETNTWETPKEKVLPDPLPPQGDSIFLSMYNQLSLLNVLYFGGSLLIIGAYSLLMNLAWERCSKAGISGVMILQTVAFGLAGTCLCNTSYQFLGGLLCSVSTGLVPYTVYWIERALGMWPKEDPGFFQNFRLYIRPGWIIMEIATIIVGLSYLSVIRFPFLLAPVSFSMWFLSMDVVPLLPQWGTTHDLFKLRRLVSIAFGLVLMTSGRVMEAWLGSEPDFGFWLYLFGLIAFWFTIVTEEHSNNHLKHSLFLLINVILVLIGSHLQRNTFHFFGTMGVALLLVGTGYNQLFTRGGTVVQRSLLLWMIKGLAVTGLLAQAVKHEGSVEIVSALMCFMSFNIDSSLFIPLGEHYCLLLLLTNLGFVAATPSFNHTLSLWVLETDGLQSIMSLMSFSVLLYHLSTFKHMARRKLGLSSLLFLSYKVVVSVFVSLLLQLLGQSWYVWTAGVGVVVVAMILLNKTPRLMFHFVQFFLLLSSIGFSIYLSSNLFYLISCVCMSVVIIGALQDSSLMKISGCGFSIALILLSVPLQSKLMITIGIIYIFGYLSHLAYVVFNKSVLFPLALVALGLSIIYGGVLYQSHQEELYEWSVSLLPDINLRPLSTFKLYEDFKSAEFSLQYILAYPHLCLLYPGVLIQALSKESFPYVGFVCSVGMVLVLACMGYVQLVSRYCPDLTDSVKVKSMKLLLNERGIKNGFIIKIKGEKPNSLELPKYMALNIKGDHFWSVMSYHFTGLAISVARSAFLPYQISPCSITNTGFKLGSTDFTLTIQIATGQKGLGRNTILNNARKIQDNLAVMECSLLYSNSFCLPYCPLCAHSLAVNDACQMLLPRK